MRSLRMINDIVTGKTTSLQITLRPLFSPTTTFALSQSKQLWKYYVISLINRCMHLNKRPFILTSQTICKARAVHL